MKFWLVKCNMVQQISFLFTVQHFNERLLLWTPALFIDHHSAY